MNFFAQTSAEPNVITDPTVPAAADTTMAAPLVAAYLLIVLFLLICIVKVYTKANRKWWEAIIPIYSIYVLQKIVGRPGWWVLLYFIPLVNIVVSVINIFDLAKVFGKGAGSALGLIFLPIIFYPILAFGKAKYTAPAGAGTPNASTTAGTDPGSNLNAQAVASVPTAGAAVGAGVGAAQPGEAITSQPLADQAASDPNPGTINPAPPTPAAEPVAPPAPEPAPVTETPVEAPAEPAPAEPVAPPSETPTDPVTPAPAEPTVPSPEDPQQPNNLVQ